MPIKGFIMNSGLVLVNSEWTKERIQLVKDTYCKGSTDNEFQLFVGTCQKLNLSPEARQVFAVKRWDSSLKREVMAIQISIDGFRLAAERTGHYAGQDGPFWCGEDGVWQDVWLSETPPVAAKVGVYRKDWVKPIYAVARFKTYSQTKKDGSLTMMWAKMDDLMIAKCAESLALRKAFPNDLSGIYSQDEMAQSENEQKPQPQPRSVDQRAPAKIQSRCDRVLSSFASMCKSEGITPNGLEYVLEDYCKSKPFIEFGDVQMDMLSGLKEQVKSGSTTLKAEFEKLYA